MATHRPLAKPAVGIEFGRFVVEVALGRLPRDRPGFCRRGKDAQAPVTAAQGDDARSHPTPAVSPMKVSRR